jgi:hypothetical protein
MKLRSAVIVTLLWAFSPASWSGDIVKTGGDSLVCNPVSVSLKYPAFQMYVLDYVLAFPDDPAELAQVPDLKASFDRIENLLAKNSPDKVQSFRDFRASIGTDGPASTPSRNWNPSDNPLPEVPDGYPNLVPSFCSAPPEFFRSYWQTVIRMRDPDKPGIVTYQYDSQLMKNYFHSPLQRQASILLVHEWLWDFYEGQPMAAVLIRTANAYLHSKVADRASPAEFNRNVF